MLSIRLDAFTRGLSRLISHFLHFRLIFQLLDTSARNGWAAALLVRYFHCNLSFFAAVSNLLICFDAFTRGLSRLISHFLHFRLILQLMDTSARNGWAAALLVRYVHCNLSFFAAVSILLICFDAFTRVLSRLISHFLLLRWILICGLFGSSAVGSATSLVRPFRCNFSFFVTLLMLSIRFDAFT